LAGLARVDEWNAVTRQHAQAVHQALQGLPQVVRPLGPADSTHVYYQYCAYVPDRDALVRASIRRGVDVETRHVDVCTRLPIFEAEQRECPGADRAADVVQIPVYSTLSERQVRRVVSVVGRALSEQRSAASGVRPGQPETRRSQETTSASTDCHD
jgi:dTDP-4-amino-4,6-dideoxygalactose transaminase